MSDHLCEDFVREILARLPVKGLVRFRCVSKLWDSLISSRFFLAYHIKNSAINEDLHILGYWDWDVCGLTTKVFYVHSDDKTALLDLIEMGKDIQFSPFRNLRTDSSTWSWQDAYIVGCCNGLLCLKVSGSSFGIGTRYVLWNPSIRKCKMIPPSSIENKFPDFERFGYDSITDDYKLVRFFRDEIEIFSLNRGYWQTPIRCLDNSRASWGVFLNGAFHFLVKNQKYEDADRTIKKHSYHILVFDLHEELFREIAIPDTLFDHRQQHGRIYKSNIRNFMLSNEGLLLLVLIKSTYHEIDENRHGYHEHMELWVMKEYGVVESWTKLFEYADIRDDPFCRLEFNSVIGARENGELLYTCDCCSEGGLSCYNPNPEIKSESNGMCGSMFHYSAYAESLTLLLDGVPQQDLEKSFIEVEKEGAERQQREEEQQQKEYDEEEAIERSLIEDIETEEFIEELDSLALLDEIQQENMERMIRKNKTSWRREREQKRCRDTDF